MSIWIHVANVLFFASYLVRDILWLRVLTIVAGSLLLPYYYLRPAPLWDAIAWNLVFTALNAYQIYRLLLERRPVTLNEDEQRLYQRAFRTLTPREFRKLILLARWEDAKSEERIVERGRELDRMMVIASGRTLVEVDGRKIVELKEGQFVGEMSFLTGEAPNANVVALEPVRYVSWPKKELKAFLDKSPDLRAALQMVIGTDLVAKLRPI